MMLVAALGARGGESFRIGYVAGLAHYLVSLYWLLLIPVTGFPILGWLALSAFLALLPATWVWLSLKVSRSEFRVPALDTAHATQPGTLLPQTWLRRTAWAIFCAATWVALEMLIARLFGGFPWNLLGDSQFRIVPLIQIASFTGVYGVSFLVVWTSVCLLCAAAGILGKANSESRQTPLVTARAPWVGEIILPFLAVIAASGFGFHRIATAPPPARELKLMLVQPSIPQTLIWNPQNDAQRFQDLVRLSEAALSNKTDVLIWPEAALPGLPRFDREAGDAISKLARSHKVWLIIGADDAEVTPGATNYFNASFLVSPDGRLADAYRKRSLVMFGEYIPLERWLPFIKWFTPITGSYTPGDRAAQFQMTFPKGGARSPLRAADADERERRAGSGAPYQTYSTSVLICFEDTFPQLARASATTNTDFLVNITNDGWFGEGAAQWQHAAAATFRTVENGLPLVRCANTGITCWIDSTGRWREVFTDETGSVYGAGFMTAKIPLPAAGEKPQTFYNRHGDWFGWSCVGFVAAVLGIKKSRKNFA